MSTFGGKPQGLGSCVFGLPFTVVSRRFYLNSRSTSLDLRAMHNNGEINLYAAAGLWSDCDGAPINRPRGEVVYAGTRSPFPTAIFGFSLTRAQMRRRSSTFTPSRKVFERDLDLAKRLAYTIGIELSWESLGQHKIKANDPEFVGLRGALGRHIT